MTVLSIFWCVNSFSFHSHTKMIPHSFRLLITNRDLSPSICQPYIDIQPQSFCLSTTHRNRATVLPAVSHLREYCHNPLVCQSHTEILSHPCRMLVTHDIAASSSITSILQSRTEVLSQSTSHTSVWQSHIREFFHNPSACRWILSQFFIQLNPRTVPALCLIDTWVLPQPVSHTTIHPM